MMTQSKQTTRVWSDAIRGSEILSNWVKLGTSAVFLWLTIGIGLGGFAAGLWFFESTTSLDRRLWIHHIRNAAGLGGKVANLPNPDGSSTRIQVPKEAVARYTARSYALVYIRLRESAVLGTLIAIGAAATAAYFLRQSARTATEDRHIRGATLAPVETVVTLARAANIAYDFTLAGVPLFRDAETITSWFPVRRGASGSRGRSLRFSDKERALLARKAFGIPRKVLLKMGTIVTPDTLLCWQHSVSTIVVVAK